VPLPPVSYARRDYDASPKSARTVRQAVCFSTRADSRQVAKAQTSDYLHATMIRLVLFDVDGTLIRSVGAGTEAYARALASEFGVNRVIERINFGGRTDLSLAREMFALGGIEPTAQNFRRFFDCYPFWLDHLLAQTRGEIVPGVCPFLRQLQNLSSPPLLGLLTGNIRLGAEIKLRHFGLWEVFQTGAFGDDHEDRNQIAAIARERANRILNEELRGEEILVVGDTPHDIRCGRAISAKVLAVATGGATLEQLRAHKPDWLARDLREVTAEEMCVTRWKVELLHR
jgi:phosphoglycolate phosphatase